MERARVMRFPDTEICYECGEPFFDLEKLGDQLLCALCHRDVTNGTTKELDTD
jgi:formylmethanofuran dehydrogenase subunit E